MPAILPPAIYPAVFTDRHGSDTITIINNGGELRMTLRGVEFVGSDFDDFHAEIGAVAARIAPFDLHPKYGGLCSYVLEFDIPIPVVVDDKLTHGTLHAKLELGAPTERGGVDKELLQLSLELGSETFASPDTTVLFAGYFEGEMLALQATLPDGAYMKACINCAFSDYSVYGHGCFGNMMCFRHEKARYLAVQGKDEYMNFVDDFGCEDMVQETYLCPEFQRRTPGTGYRG
jgi:hypothetical protein